MKTKFVRIALIIGLPLLSGCGMCRSIEQWKCDNWGMCHFAPNRPGVYSPSAVQPTYGAPMNYGAPTAIGSAPAGYASPSSTGGVTVGGPASTGAPMGMPPVGSANPNCKDCNR